MLRSMQTQGPRASQRRYRRGPKDRTANTMEAAAAAPPVPVTKHDLSTPPNAPDTPPSTPPMAQAQPHPAWLALAAPAATKLAWRLAACQNTLAQCPRELARGGLLQIMQRNGLQVPPNTKGAVNAYVTGNLKDELAAAVQAHLSMVTDPFYGMSPQANVNYGGKGAGQQLWWAGDAKGWRVTQPNRHLMNKTAAPPPGAHGVTRDREDSSAGSADPHKKVRRNSTPQAEVLHGRVLTEPQDRPGEHYNPGEEVHYTTEGEEEAIRQEDIHMLPILSRSSVGDPSDVGDTFSDIDSIDASSVASFASDDQMNVDVDLLLLDEGLAGGPGTPDTGLLGGDPSGGTGTPPPCSFGSNEWIAPEWIAEEYGATHDRYLDSPSMGEDYATQEAPPPPPLQQAMAKSMGGGILKHSTGGARPQQPEKHGTVGGGAPSQQQFEGGKGSRLSGAELFTHVCRLASSLPQHQRQVLHQRLGASLPLPTVVEAQPVGANGLPGHVTAANPTAGRPTRARVPVPPHANNPGSSSARRTTAEQFGTNKFGGRTELVPTYPGSREYKNHHQPATPHRSGVF